MVETICSYAFGIVGLICVTVLVCKMCKQGEE